MFERLKDEGGEGKSGLAYLYAVLDPLILSSLTGLPTVGLYTTNGTNSY